MSYKKLSYGQYYIDVSNDYKKTGKARYNISFDHYKFIYKLFKLIPIKFSSEMEIHYEEDRNVIQINFEETNGVKDWIINFLFWQKMYDKFEWKNKENGKTYNIQLKACRGWANMFKAMKKAMESRVSAILTHHPDANIEIIGWSLGSSQAQFACQDINWKFGKLPYMYTYGSVKPWRGGKKQKEYLSSTYKEAYNFMHRSDIICYMPPFAGYFATKSVKLGKFNFFKLFNPYRWHTEYDVEDLYKEVK